VLASGRLQDADATKRFMEGITLPPLEEVPRFLIANTHTPKWRLAGALFTTMISFLRRQTGKFSVHRMLEETFPDWECMGTDLRRYLTSVAKEIVDDLCENELRDFARIGRATHSPGERLIEFSVDVLGQDASTRTRTFQKLLRLAFGYIERSKEDRPYEPTRLAETPWLPGFEPEQN
jgi:hypothetical protein